MLTIINYFILLILALIISEIIIPIIRKFALQTNIMEKLNHKKKHHQPKLQIGGISIGCIFTICSFVFINENKFIEYLPIIFTAFIILNIGVIEDKTVNNAKYKLIIEIILSFFIAATGTRITSLYGFLGIDEIHIFFQYIITIIVITGVMNVFNLMDEIKGLIGSISILGFILILIAGILSNDTILIKISLIFIGSLIGFLKYNLSREKIFMGDSGSLFLGFLLITFGIFILEKKDYINNQINFFENISLIIFFVIPVLDSLRVYLIKIKKGKSVINYDNPHFHQIFLKIACSHKKATLYILTYIILFIILGFGILQIVNLFLCCIILTSIFYFSLKFLYFINNLYKWKNKIVDLEKN